MSVASPATNSQASRRFRRSLVAVSAVALGAGALLAPSASAADQWGPGFLIPDSAGHTSASHIGGYRSAVPDVIAYRADPGLTGPQAADGYGAVGT